MLVKKKKYIYKYMYNIADGKAKHPKYQIKGIKEI